MNQSSVRPAWETIFGASSTTKNYCAQCDALRLKDGLLQRQWVTTDGLNRYWQKILPRKMRSEILGEMHSNPTSGHLGVKKTLSRLRQRPPDEERTEETTSYVKSLQERLTKVHHKVRGALEFSGEVMKRNYDVKASLVCYKDDVTYWIRGKKKAHPKVVHVNRLWQYHGPGQYTWEDSEELSPTTDEDQTRDPWKNSGPHRSGEPDHGPGRGALFSLSGIRRDRRGGPI
ncbi:putative Integrase zinc binding domain-containing protein 4 [Homarus americanus]|uniref:Putative Integrase zinc binding domain-containing protein 4 n=1 Tax=Homarus americanus TaxID=6706 RepID=A0A8J5JMM1_HOMAM|nr:putative Integrase zinc binding domain-containing protein 4 [Homarus americanus]